MGKLERWLPCLSALSLPALLSVCLHALTPRIFTPQLHRYLASITTVVTRFSFYYGFSCPLISCLFLFLLFLPFPFPLSPVSPPYVRGLKPPFPPLSLSLSLSLSPHSLSISMVIPLLPRRRFVVVVTCGERQSVSQRASERASKRVGVHCPFASAAAAVRSLVRLLMLAESRLGLQSGVGLAFKLGDDIRRQQTGSF